MLVRIYELHTATIRLRSVYKQVEAHLPLSDFVGLPSLTLAQPPSSALHFRELGPSVC